MSDADLVPVLVAAAFAGGLAVCALVAADRPARDEERAWRERPPLGWRLAWPVVRWIGRLIDPVLLSAVRSSLSRLLRQASLDASLDASQVVAGCALAAVCATAASAFIVRSAFDAGPAPTAHADAWTRLAILLAALLAAGAPVAWLRDRRAARLRSIARSLPFFLDVVTLSVESGANLTGALQHAVAKGPPGPLRDELDRVLRDVRAGRTRAESLRALSERLEMAAMSSWVSALVAAERHGSSLGPVLRAQAEQRRLERFQQAEAQAMKAPVKMLFPLLVFIFPCTFVLLFFPVVVRLLEEGVLR